MTVLPWRQGERRLRSVLEIHPREYAIDQGGRADARHVNQGAGIGQCVLSWTASNIEEGHGRSPHFLLIGVKRNSEKQPVSFIDEATGGNIRRRGSRQEDFALSGFQGLNGNLTRCP